MRLYTWRSTPLAHDKYACNNVLLIDHSTNVPRHNLHALEWPRDKRVETNDQLCAGLGDSEPSKVRPLIKAIRVSQSG